MALPPIQQTRAMWRAWARANGYAGANGAILHKGPSAIDPSVDVVVIVTGLARPSANPKTADLLQTWILVDSPRTPLNVARALDDYAICGDCPHRYNPETGKRSCYVTLHQGPRSVHAAYQRGAYPEVSPAWLANRARGVYWRLGAYGDPAAVPVEVWQTLTHTAKGHTGYTHQWRRLDATAWAPLVMASTDTDEDTEAAHAAGWRQFRVVAEHAPISRGRLLVAGLTLRQCPATTPADLTCQACRACDGTSRGAKRPSIVIPAHGNGASHVA